MHFNTKYIFKGDTEREIIGKINYNFDQILSFAVGPDGHGGPIGPTGIFGPAGKRGASGNPGIRASNWYKQPFEPGIDVRNPNDIWIDNSISDGEVKVFDGSTWNPSGYTFLNSKYFKSYSYILGPGGASDKYAIGFKNPGGLTAASAMSLIINDSGLIPSESNPNNSKVLVSTNDQTDSPIMSFSKNGAISDDVPSFYWSSVGNNSGLKFDTGGSFYITTKKDFKIDSDSSRTLITSDYCNFKSNNGKIGISGDGDFTFSSNTSIGGGSFLSISTANLNLNNLSFNYKGAMSIESIFSSTYIFDSSPTLPGYKNGVSVSVTEVIDRALDFNDFTANPVLSTRPFGPLGSGSFGQTTFGSTGGFTGGTAGPFSYHVKKVNEIRKSAISITARKYQTPSTNTPLNDVFDISSNNDWVTDNIVITPSSYGPASNSPINSSKVGLIDKDFAYNASYDKFGKGFSRGVSGTISGTYYNAVVNDFWYDATDGSTIFVGNFTHYNDAPVTNGINATIGLCKIKSNGTMDLNFRTNISAIPISNATSVNGIVYNSDGLLVIYGDKLTSYSSTRSGFMVINKYGVVDSVWFNNVQGGFGLNTGPFKAISQVNDIDGICYIFAVGNFTQYSENGYSTLYYTNKVIKIIASGSNRGKVVTAFMPSSTQYGPGFVNIGSGQPYQPYCLDITKTGSLIIGGSFNTFVTTHTADPQTTVSTPSIVELNSTTGAILSANQYGGLSGYTATSIYGFGNDPIVMTIKYNQNEAETLTGGNVIYIGGGFISLNGIVHNRLAKFKIVNHKFIMDHTFNSGAGFDDVVTDIAFDSTPGYQDLVYVGGRFTSYNNTPVSGFVALNNTNGDIDSTKSIYHQLTSPGTIVNKYIYDLGIVRKIYTNAYNNIFLYAGGFLKSNYGSPNAVGGIYLKVPSSLSQNYFPVYTEGTSTTYRVFLNDLGNNPNARFIAGLVFDTGLPNAATQSYVDFTPNGASGCQYVDLMWVSKSSTSNLSPRLFYKTCQGRAGYIDFGATGVYSQGGSTTVYVGQPVSVSWNFNMSQTGSIDIFKNGTSISNNVLSRTTPGSGNLAYTVDDKIYVIVDSDGGDSQNYRGSYASLKITKTSLTTGIESTSFEVINNNILGVANNTQNPVNIEAGYSYNIRGATRSQYTNQH